MFNYIKSKKIGFIPVIKIGTRETLNPRNKRRYGNFQQRTQNFPCQNLQYQATTTIQSTSANFPTHTQCQNGNQAWGQTNTGWIPPQPNVYQNVPATHATRECQTGTPFVTTNNQGVVITEVGDKHSPNNNNGSSNC